MFDELGDEIVYTHVEQPAAQLFWDPENAETYDVFVYYDAMARGAGVTRPDGSVHFEEPSAEAKRDLEALLKVDMWASQLVQFKSGLLTAYSCSTTIHKS